MSKKQQRVVRRTGSGRWVNKPSGGARAATVHVTQSDALRSARQMLKSEGGGVLVIHKSDGAIRSKDTVPAAEHSHGKNIRGHVSGSSSRTQHVVSRSDGSWSVRASGAERASKTFPRKGDAIDYARTVARNGGVELYIHSRDGRIQDRVSYGSDPHPPRR